MSWRLKGNTDKGVLLFTIMKRQKQNLLKILNSHIHAHMSEDQYMLCLPYIKSATSSSMTYGSFPLGSSVNGVVLGG